MELKLPSKLIFSVLLIMFLVPSLIVSASFTDAWGEYQDDPSNRGFVNDVASNYDEVGITLTINNGMSFQPLVVDMAGSNNLEIIIYSGNFLQLYNSNLNLIDERNLGGSIQSQPTIYNNGSLNFALALVDNVTEAWAYNGTGFVDGFVNDTQLNGTCNTYLGLKCIDDDLCFTVCDVGGEIITLQIDMVNQVWIESEPFTTANIQGTPAIDDLDRDGRDEMAFICGGANYGVCVVDLNGSGTPFMDTGFSGDGLVDAVALVDRIANPVIFNIDEAGDLEIILAYAEPTPGGLEIAAYNSDGSVSWTREHSDGITTAPIFVSNPIILPFPSDRPDVCAFGRDTSPNVITTVCTDFEGTLINESILTYVGSGSNEQGWNAFAAPVIDGTICTDSSCSLDIVTTRFIMDRIGGTGGNFSVHFNLTDFGDDYFISYADVNQDGEGEIIGTNGSITKIVFSTFQNQPPELNNSLNFGGYGSNFDYLQPICVGTTLTFTAQECGGTVTDCNYDNDGGIDTERVVSNCGQLESGFASTSFTNNLANGTFAGSTPTFSCVYNVTGAFPIRLFLQDDFNPNDFSVFNTQTINLNVLNGTSGITCNFAGFNPSEGGGIPATSQEVQNNEAIEATLGILFGEGSGSDKLKLMVGIAIILGVMAAAYREGVTNGVTQIIIGGLATILVTFVGLLTPAVLLVIFAFLILIIFLGRAIMSTSSPEG